MWEHVVLSRYIIAPFSHTQRTVFCFHFLKNQSGAATCGDRRERCASLERSHRRNGWEIGGRALPAERKYRISCGQYSANHIDAIQFCRNMSSIKISAVISMHTPQPEYNNKFPCTLKVEPCTASLCAVFTIHRAH